MVRSRGFGGVGRHWHSHLSASAAVANSVIDVLLDKNYANIILTVVQSRTFSLDRSPRIPRLSTHNRTEDRPALEQVQG
jgi:hypothetical protein